MPNRKPQLATKLRAILAGVPAALLAYSCATQAEATTENHYGVTISTNKTQNMTFNNGVYAATGDGANLNVSDLENALAAGTVEVTTGNGSGGDEKGDLHVDSGFTWSSGHALTLDAYRAMFFSAAVVDAGKGGLTLTTNDGGTGGAFVYEASGSITILNLQDALHINGVRFLLDGSIKSLAGDILAKPDGNYALANSYDASQDGVYAASPITTTYTGSFDGLGNTISNLKIKADTTGGLFLEVDGTVRDLHLDNALVTEGSGTSWVGALAGIDRGLIENVSSSGKVTSSSGYYVGGLVGASLSYMTNCSSSATVLHKKVGGAGGLAGYSAGTLSNSFATGPVTVKGQGYAGALIGIVQGAISSTFATGSVAGGDKATVGGLIGSMLGGSVINSYATGAVMGGLQANAGGLIGSLEKHFTPSVTSSYSAGSVGAGPQSWVGGLLGLDGTNGQTGCGCLSDTYWDTDTSGITDPAQGSGNIPNEAGITALTSDQLKSGLPAGFDPAIWAEKRKINHHFPYLIHNPPLN